MQAGSSFGSLNNGYSPLQPHTIAAQLTSQRQRQAQAIQSQPGSGGATPPHNNHAQAAVLQSLGQPQQPPARASLNSDDGHTSVTTSFNARSALAVGGSGALGSGGGGAAVPAHAQMAAAMQNVQAGARRGYAHTGSGMSGSLAQQQLQQQQQQLQQQQQAALGGAGGGGSSMMRDDTGAAAAQRRPSMSGRMRDAGSGRFGRARRVSSGGDLAASDSLRGDTGGGGAVSNNWDPFFLEVSEEMRTVSEDARAGGSGSTGGDRGGGGGGKASALRCDSAHGCEADSRSVWGTALPGDKPFDALAGGRGASGYGGASVTGAFGDGLSAPGGGFGGGMHYLSAPAAAAADARLAAERVRDPGAHT